MARKPAALIRVKPTSLESRLKKIKLLVIDVDGVMTDAGLFYVDPNGWTRRYSVYDGIGIKLALQLGFRVAVISAGSSDDIRNRCELLKIPDVHLGSEDKLPAYESLLAKYQLRDDEAAYIADELFDLPVLRRVGVSASVPDAVDSVKAAVDFVTKRRGGSGAVREFIDRIRFAQKRGPEFP